MKKQIKVAYFPSTATKNVVLSGNGKSLDKYCIKCETEEDLSTGNYILDATFLIEDNLQDILQEEVILKVLMDYGEEVFRISKPIVGTRYITIVARQITIADELTLWLEDVRPTTQSGAVAGSYMVTNATGVKEIQVISDISNLATAYYPKMSLYKALYDCDQSFLNKWGGEILRRGYINYINAHIGIGRGFAIREGKNLTGFECSSNIDNLVTRAQGRGFNGIVGNYIDSPLINAYNRIYTDVIEYPDIKVKDENNTEGYDTLALAQNELNRRIQEEYSKNGIDKIKASYNINFVQLEKTDKYKDYIIAERVYLGDSIGVYIPRLNTDIQVRAIAKQYDVLAQKTKEIRLSNYIESKTLTIKQIIDRLETMDSTESVLQQAKKDASVLIKAGIKNSFVTVRENEIIIGDTKDINTMTNVWRWTNGGLGFSSTGYYGTFGTAITSDGKIVADFITTGTLNASLATITNINAINITAGILRGIQIQEISDSGILLAELYKNSNGGVLTLNDMYGSLNVKMGSEGPLGNKGGTLILYNKSVAYPRVELGIDGTYGSGVLNLKDSSGTVRASLYAESGLGTMLTLRNAAGSPMTYLRETLGVINNEVIATQDWVDANALKASGNIVNLPNGCYLECLSGRLILHANASNYVSIGAGQMQVYENGVARPI